MNALLVVQQLCKTYALSGSPVGGVNAWLRRWSRHGGATDGQGQRLLHAVDNVSFTIAAGESVGLVGESGCGKSTVTVQVPKIRLVTPVVNAV